MTTEKQQTPLQKGIDKIKVLKLFRADNKCLPTTALDEAIVLLQSLLPEEKQMVIDAYGDKVELNKNGILIETSGEQYFNKIFK